MFNRDDHALPTSRGLGLDGWPRQRSRRRRRGGGGDDLLWCSNLLTLPKEAWHGALAPLCPQAFPQHISSLNGLVDGVVVLLNVVVDGLEVGRRQNIL